MKNVKEIKARIKSITETAQITKAMELISASKMQKASLKYNNNRAYFSRIRECIFDILTYGDLNTEQIYLKKRQEGYTFFLIIGSDKGLAGEYNHSLLSFAANEVRSVEKRKIFCIGTTVYNYFQGLGEDVENISYNHEPILEDARIIATDFTERYKAGEMREMVIIFTKLVSKAMQKPQKIRLLPILKEDFEAKKEDMGRNIKLYFEPNVSSVMKILAPQYILGIVYSCLIESKYGEHLERMRAMNAATESANDIVSSLQIKYNKARQEKITTEMTELSSSHIDEY